MYVAPAKIAAVWFGDGERAIATTVGALAMPLGSIGGFILPAILVPDSTSTDPEGKSVIENYILIQNIVITVMALPILFLIRNKPPTPPSASSVSRKMGLCESMKRVFMNKDCVFVILAFSFCYSLYMTLGSVVGPFTAVFGYDPSDNTYFGAAFIMVGVVGSFIHAVFLDKYGKFRL